ncbi:MAG: hypothetical protein ABSF28_07725 [Terracidiphilus sp.]|jgi:hypothetical protein
MSESNKCGFCGEHPAIILRFPKNEEAEDVHHGNDLLRTKWGIIDQDESDPGAADYLVRGYCSQQCFANEIQFRLKMGYSSKDPVPEYRALPEEEKMAIQKSLLPEVRGLVIEYVETAFALYEQADAAGDKLVYALAAIARDHGREAVADAVRVALPADWEGKDHIQPFPDAGVLMEQVDAAE